ncbi:putative monooxygenase [Mycena metata]|uniref:Monooxygenase n=1 Tax=Mycena metata TaxID=1033252 RepID=A0AAD7NJT6_9AGAR|nr:putative monooxygenase [Mycena metata]
MSGLLSMASPQATTLLMVAAATTVLLLAKALTTRKHNLPPGPRRLPVVGSALQMPRSHPWLTFAEWAKTYGSIVYADVVGQPLIILNSRKAAMDLLDGRSAIYSDRPRNLVMAILSGYAETFAMKPYGEDWRQQRKIVMQDFSQTAITRYSSIQEREGRKLVWNVLNKPSSLRSEIKLRLGSIIIRVTYGHTLTGDDDPMLTSPLTAMDNFSKATQPGAWLVDFVPSLQFLPKWTPGAGFLKTASEWRRIVHNTSWNAYLWTKNNLESGKVLVPNMCATVLESVDKNPSTEQEAHLVWSASAVMGGGMDTNMSTLLILFLAMMLNPAIQAKARKELDDIIGQDRLPTIADKASLPYIKSVMVEVFRWNPAIPLGVAHALTEDDIYEGMYLPKGSLMIPNVWYMLHDPEVYPNPHEFNPDRYGLDDAEMNKVTDIMFGFGRRVCPGRLFAEATFFTVVSTILSTCEILPPVDAQGKKVLPEITFTNGTIIFPADFNVNIKCRSEKAWELLRSVQASEVV